MNLFKNIIYIWKNSIEKNKDTLVFTFLGSYHKIIKLASILIW